MKKPFLFIFLLLVNSNLIFSQISEGGIPESFKTKKKSFHYLPVFSTFINNVADLLQQDVVGDIPLRYGIVIDQSIDITGQGLCDSLPNGTIWQYKISCSNAFSIGLYFNTFKIPEGAKLFLYNEDHSSIEGAFTNRNYSPRNDLMLAAFPGNHLVVEYFEPFSAEFHGKLVLGALSLAYKNISNLLAAEPDSLTEYVDVNCKEGDNIQDIKHSVCRITFNNALFSYLCSGALINNARNDGTPYFLTANHCIDSEKKASSAVAYFNYEKDDCNGEAGSFNTLTGATIKASNTKSDFCLIEFDRRPPSNYQPYYAGWNVVDEPAESSVCIHHPEGLEKKISVDYDPSVNVGELISWKTGGTSPKNSHWQITFDLGAMNEGSSGAPLFNQDKLIVGQLHGSSKDEGFFGKLSYSWNYNSTSDKQLKAWLDPDNSGLKTINGYAPATLPEPNFTAKYQTVCNDAPVKFHDKSEFNPTSWNWSVYPSTYSFENGTSSNSQNPEISFHSKTSYTVSLEAYNSYGIKTRIKHDYINAGSSLDLSLSGIPQNNTLCGCLLNNYSVVGTGADTFTFQVIENAEKFNISTSGDSLLLTLKKEALQPGIFNTTIKATGVQGACSTEKQVRVRIASSINDDIENAIELKPGVEISATNFCASIQANEPYPKTGFCDGGSLWCDESSFSALPVQHTIWFKFKPELNGFVNIATSGFDNQIALYQADSANYLFELSKSNYSLIASNDNKTSYNKEAGIASAKIKSGEQYWLQLDGSNGGIEDTCTIVINYSSISVFPNPGNGKFYLVLTSSATNTAKVMISDMTGVVVLRRNLSLTNIENSYEMKLNTGVYVVSVTLGKYNYLNMVVIY